MRHPFVVCLYAAAMGCLESAVVVYLRRIYYPDGFRFPLEPMEPAILRVEIIREAMTLFMLLAVAWMAAERFWPRLSAFLVAFGVWDLSYYAGLKLFLDWPSSLLEPDILFLIPKVWVGPVLAPALVAAAWVAGGLLLHDAGDQDLRVTWRIWVVAGVATGLTLASFLVTSGSSSSPRFLWGLFIAGYTLGIAVLLHLILRVRRQRRGVTKPGGSSARPAHP